MDRACQPTAPLTSTSAEMNDHPVSLEVTCGQHVGSPAVVGFLDKNYRYKSIANQNPHEPMLAPFPNTR